MKIASLYPSLLIASMVCATSTVALDETSLAFPDEKIELPALSLAEIAKGNLPPVLKSPPPVFMGHGPKPTPALKSNNDKFVIQPDKSVDYKLTIKAPDASVDYRLIVKNPDTAQSK